MAFNKEKTYEEFAKMLLEVSKVSSYQQAIMYPVMIVSFLEDIYDKAYKEGYLKHRIETEAKNIQNN